MKNKFINLAIFCLVFLLSGCANNAPKTDYSAFLQKKPTSILVLMPTNESVEVKGASAVLAHSVMPLSEAGYYVLPVSVAHETFKSNGLSEAGEIHAVSAAKLKEIFGADAALYLKVLQYGSSYKVVSSNTIVSVEGKLVDLGSGATLWQKTASAQSGSGSGGGNLFVMLISAAIEQIASSISDKSYDVSAMSDALLLGQDCNDCLLYGPLSPNFSKDKQLQKN
ncbi:DUF799 domain-containing protein [Campylobacter sp. VBCF_06 NA8]|uniref:DUF799 domain-containing protein n=1 Tax=Campylobacter sp. VBCF_06 NA8 TaxID=2983822 RepID=UPI0022E9ABEB|nr:GNA1162 family protein [Campylobacter sp. VBCF_06 NA8]MDA3046768.1 DUF799 domain-containing protein [Campylobacter sp. VBCF_06 NA8]